MRMSSRISKDIIQDNVQVKVTLGNIGRSIVSLAVPGDTDPIRSPVRSAVYRTLTPGFGMGRGSASKPNRGYRCPEGYQYGGRFTDSRLSTCGAKLFDIPSPLGLALSQLRRAFGKIPKSEVSSQILGAGNYPGDTTVRRDPNIQIPKVSSDNRRVKMQNVREMVSGIGNTRYRVSRMVRRDGFVLEPVVPPKVLRAIPDNRDMEGATYLISALSSKDIGNDELGLLSNTGVTSVMYVMPGGSTLTIEKARQLTVGERRKLGKTIRVAESMQRGSDPSSRLKYVANEMGDGIAYSESFADITNPNEIVGNKPKWATMAFDLSRIKEPKLSSRPSRSTVSSEQAGKKIDSLNEALEHVANGGSLSQVSPKILQKVLSKAELIKERRIDAKQSIVDAGTMRYIRYKPSSDYQHLAERFASDVQQHLGLESPDILMIGPGSPRRQYLREDIETALPGSKFNPNGKLSDFKPEDVAKMMIADFLTDQRERPLSSVYALTTIDGEVPMMAQNFSSGLTDLSKIEITKRTKMNIANFYSSNAQIDYSKYYSELKKEQQIAYRRFIEQLISRARSFKVRELRSRLSPGGLTDGEIAHLKIIEKIYDTRLDILSQSKRQISEYLKG
jgi:hypothetical protein